MMNRLNEQYDIILGSGSPRRKELLEELGLKFRISTQSVDESYPKDMDVRKIASYLAEKKANAFPTPKFNEMLITADTIVTDGNEVFGKPKDEADAVKMLQSLSGRKHNVISGVCIITKARKEIFSAETIVTFDELSLEVIDYYIKNFQPFDKAGAYGIQEWFGMVAVSHIEGSYFNVMGLPVQILHKKLLTFVEL